MTLTETLGALAGVLYWEVGRFHWGAMLALGDDIDRAQWAGRLRRRRDRLKRAGWMASWMVAWPAWLAAGAIVAAIGEREGRS